MIGQDHTIMVTGAAGFIGFHVSRTLLRMGARVVGIDNLSDYYDVALKRDRLKVLNANDRFVFYHENIQNLEVLKEIFGKYPVDMVCNLAAQTGVRYSIENPFVYQESNLEGFLNLMEMAR